MWYKFTSKSLLLHFVVYSTPLSLCGFLGPFFLFYNWVIKSFQLMWNRLCSIFRWCCWKTIPWGVPNVTFCLWLNSLERLFVCSFVSLYGCGSLCECVCTMCMCVSVVRRTIEWTRPQGSLHSFQYDPNELLCQMPPVN